MARFVVDLGTQCGAGRLDPFSQTSKGLGQVFIAKEKEIIKDEGEIRIQSEGWGIFREESLGAFL